MCGHARTFYEGNPFFLIKFPVIALALVNAIAINRSPAWRARHVRELSGRERRVLAVMGSASLVCWMTAIAAGRMIGYW